MRFSLISFILFLLIGIFALLCEKPIPVKPADGENFSALNVKTHLDKMASEIHFMGTAENRKVKNYILDEFKKLSIPTEEFIGYSKHTRNVAYSRIGKTENIIATLKGESSDKALMLCAHYDSVLDGPGAADDVHAVACMLEIAKLLKDKKFKNDIIFFITDGEEMGLFGAKAYAETHDLDKLGLILNYEARGNSGPSIAFEWSDGNGWLVRQMRKVAKRPVSSSMSYEIYNLLPNNTDYSNFKPKGVPGINHAFIDGFSYYHNPEDTPETINMNSVQHTGENMYLLAQHFADQDLTQIKTQNASFFNCLGTLVIYPASFNTILIILCSLLLLFVLIKSIKRDKTSLVKLIIGVFALLLIMIVSLGIAFLLGKAVLSIYKHYNVFYSGQYYNHTWYLGSVIGSTVLVFSLLTRWLKSKIKLSTLKLSSLVVIFIYLPALALYTPTGVYLIVLPLIALCLGILLEDVFISANKKGLAKLSQMVSAILPIALWFPISYSIFLAFSLQLLPVPVVCVFLLCLVILITNKTLLDTHVLTVLGALVFITSLLVAHIKSKPTAEHPLPSSLYYTYYAENNEAHWATSDDFLNIGNEHKLKGAESKQITPINPFKALASTTDVKPHIPLATIIEDSLKSKIKIIRPQESFLTRLIFTDAMNISSVSINGYDGGPIREVNGNKTFDIYGMTKDTMLVEIERIDNSKQQDLVISNRYKSLPEPDLMPKEVRRTSGYSNIMQKYSFR